MQIHTIGKGRITPMNKSFYTFSDWRLAAPAAIPFTLHSHDQHEILLFLEGDATYLVEGCSYDLEPGDLVIARKHEKHRMHHNSNCPYYRSLLVISPEFFQKHSCTDYEAALIKAPNGSDNKIAAETVSSSGLYDAFLRYKKYSEDYTLDKNSPVLISNVVEILYLINKVLCFSASDQVSGPVRSVILYLNNHYTDDFSLDELAQKFYLSKSYLCRAFRRSTGLTVHEYISRKRIQLVRALTAEGRTISEAALMSGFHDYSSFYRAYVKEYGTSPRNDLQ